jgi:hypothetical protein
MSTLKWSASEKKVARRAYDGTLEVAIAKVLVEVRSRASSAASASDLWAIEDYLREARKEIAEMFDYRHSRLTWVFAWAIREGHMKKASLAGLQEEKLEAIRSLAGLLGAPQ